MRGFLALLAVTLPLAMVTVAHPYTHNEHFRNNDPDSTVLGITKTVCGGSELNVSEMQSTTFDSTWWGHINPRCVELKWRNGSVAPGEYSHVCFTATDQFGHEGVTIVQVDTVKEGRSGWDFGPAVSGVGSRQGSDFQLALGNYRCLDLGPPMVPSNPIELLDLAVAFVDERLPIDSLVYEVMYDSLSPLNWVELVPDTLAVFRQWYGWTVPISPDTGEWAVVRMSMTDATHPIPYHDFMEFYLVPGLSSVGEASRSSWPIPDSWVRTSPNPSGQDTDISFYIPTEGQISLTLYRATGQRVTTLMQRRFPAGEHSVVWDGTDEEGRTLPAGVYFVRLEGQGFTSTTRIILLK